MSNKKIKEQLLDVVDDCKTQRDAAQKLGASEQYIYTLTRQLGITKWRQKNRVHVPLKTVECVCEECGKTFTKYALNNAPGRFCSKKCQGRWLGRNHGFKKKST